MENNKDNTLNQSINEARAKAFYYMYMQCVNNINASSKTGSEYNKSYDECRKFYNKYLHYMDTILGPKYDNR